jgi:hypothetical protein
MVVLLLNIELLGPAVVKSQECSYALHGRSMDEETLEMETRLASLITSSPLVTSRL